ncbi:hypothetical protein DSECCO2_533050 [anaerobic digester metagenome]
MGEREAGYGGIGDGPGHGDVAAGRNRIVVGRGYRDRGGWVQFKRVVLHGEPGAPGRVLPVRDLHPDGPGLREVGVELLWNPVCRIVVIEPGLRVHNLVVDLDGHPPSGRNIGPRYARNERQAVPADTGGIGELVFDGSHRRTDQKINIRAVLPVFPHHDGTVFGAGADCFRPRCGMRPAGPPVGRPVPRRFGRRDMGDSHLGSAADRAE